MHPIEGERYYAKYAIFSNLSFETLDNKHEYQIVLSNLCPGIPINTLFNQKRTSLFFERPFQNKKQCNDVDNTNVVIRDIDYNRVWDDTKIDYTLRKIIEDFPNILLAKDWIIMRDGHTKLLLTTLMLQKMGTHNVIIILGFLNLSAIV